MGGRLVTLMVFLAVVSGFTAVSAYSQEPVRRVYPGSGRADSGTDEVEWTAFQLSIFPGIPNSTMNSHVNGLKFGLFGSSGNGKVHGAEISTFCNSTDNVNGLQMSVIANVARIAAGVQAGLVNVATVTFDGLQVGLVNYSAETGVQVGLVNILPESAIPFLPLVNFYIVPTVRHYEQRGPIE